MSKSRAEIFAEQDVAEKLRVLAKLTPEQRTTLRYNWAFWSRPEQRAPVGAWQTWLILAGRGWGKTRTGAEWVREEVTAARRGRLALVGPTASDARDVMVEGPSGIMATAHPRFRPHYEPAKRRITWPNGALATVFSADEPERLRGPQYDGAWADELAAWRFLEAAWDNLQFGLRLGNDPRQVVTTTPKPLKQLKAIKKDPNTATTVGTTYDNRSNLAPSFFTKIVKKYEGTRLGRQELNAEILEDNPGALWNRAQLEELRISPAEAPKEYARIVVANDPAVTSREDSDETGIIGAGRGGPQDHGFILLDASLRASPDQWIKATVKAYHDLKADRVVAEINNGGDMVETLLRTVDKSISYRGVHAAKGKIPRAEPVAALYEQKRVWLVGSFPILEDQMCDYDPLTSKFSPDRMDAMVWAITELMLVDNDGALLEYLRGEKSAADAQREAEAAADRKRRGLPP